MAMLAIMKQATSMIRSVSCNGPEKLYIEKELSWLSFNERVLQEAADKSNPLIERMRFLGSTPTTLMSLQSALR